ncbi:hypothetical protein QYE76_011537 [Lolium multiflorum]|uniref:DUF4283 domain-containing protein n=1 Tax=Lolium multiflorum TaxID=4521 RepID=A0AAD8TVJ3_LOLMU|nr:hypothetical protein QYE76_011537 [Lolium multiflorum]
MSDLEQRLQLAMVATVGGQRPGVSCEQVEAALRWRGVPEGTFSVHVFAPEDFLIVCESLELRDHIAAMPAVLVAGAPLSLRPWNRQAQATLVPMSRKVTLLLEGLPPHAWDTSVVEDVLGKSCAVDAVAPETKERRDLSLFKLTAWTSDLEAIPVARMLAIPEPVPGGGVHAAPARTAAAVVRGAGEIKTLQYKILVHLVRVEEDESPSTGVRLGNGHGRGQEGPHEFGGDGGGGSGGSAGDGPRRVTRDLAWRRGVPDRRRGPGGAPSSSLGVGVAAPAPAPEKSWALPGMGSPAPLTVQTASGSQHLRQVATEMERGASGKATLAAAAADKATLAVVEDQAQEKKDREDSACSADEVGSVQTMHEIVVLEPTVVRDVAVPEPQEKGADQVIWADAPETLPLADPEAVEPAAHLHADRLGGVNRSPLSPSVASGGSTSGAAAAFSVEVEARNEPGSAPCQDKRGVEGVFGPGSNDYFCVSISENTHCHKARAREAQEGTPEQLLGTDRDKELVVDSGASQTSYTGPNSFMQLVPRGLARQLEEEVKSPATYHHEEPQHVEATLVQGPVLGRAALEQEGPELARIKRFCSSILKTLAPPLLSEFERASGLRADAEPFTPKRVTRRSVAERAGTQAKMASAAESTLLKALGFCPENFAVSDDDLRRFKELFDSPVRDEQLRVLAAIFGKELPTRFEREEHCMGAVAAH